MTKASKRSVVGVVVLFTIAAAGVAMPGSAQTWTYSSTNGYGPGANSGTIVNNGVRFNVFERNGRTFANFDGDMASCWRGDLVANVEKNDEVTLVTLVPRLTGCEELRFVLKNDGSGGQRQGRQGDQWVWDGVDRGLKLVK